MATHRPRLSPGRRITMLVGTAALGAIACSLITPTAQAVADTGDITNRQAALILAEESGGGAASRGVFRTTVETTDSSAPAAIAAVQAQARAQALDAAASAPSTQAAADPAAALPATPDGYRAYAFSKIGAAQFACLNPLWERESHWRPDARNPRSTAYGIPQLLDSTWRFTGVAKTSNGFRQVDAGLAYLRRAYGDPCTAWAHEEAHGWY